MESINLCRFLEWDTNFFGVRIARVNITRLNQGNIAAINQWCYTNRISCLYLLADADDGDTIWLAEENNFHLVDIRVTFEQSLLATRGGSGKHTSHSIRSSIPSDIPSLRAIAKVGFQITRFYYDPHFSKDLCDAMYETWIEKSCTNNDEEVLVAETQGEPVGFISCKLIAPYQGEIGLVGVRPDWQGKRLGQELIAEALDWFSSKGATLVKVVTQGRNSPAQRLYQRAGFLTNAVQIWYHKWFDQAS